jgi:hypothetical protein
MNRTEQKERIKEMVELVENAISGLGNMREDLEDFVVEYEQVYNRLQENGFEEVIGKDVEEFTAELLRKMLEDNADFATVEDELDSFKSELDDYVYELPPSRQEKIEERYSDWDDITDKIYSIQNDDDLTLDGVTEMLDDIVTQLKGYARGR